MTTSLPCFLKTLAPLGWPQALHLVTVLIHICFLENGGHVDIVAQHLRRVKVISPVQVNNWSLYPVGPAPEGSSSYQPQQCTICVGQTIQNSQTNLHCFDPLKMGDWITLESKKTTKGWFFTTSFGLVSLVWIKTKPYNPSNPGGTPFKFGTASRWWKPGM